MDYDVGHPRSSASVCSRREPSKTAQGKRGAALGEGAKRESPSLEGRIEHSHHELHNPGTVLGFHTALPGRESLGRTLSQGFTLGYFRLFPPGGTALDASLLPHLELLAAVSTDMLRTRRRPSPAPSPYRALKTRDRTGELRAIAVILRPEPK
jgi:hypothetical protein